MCLGSTGALNSVSVVMYVLAKSGLDQEQTDAQEYADSLKLVLGAEEYQKLVPSMKKALKQTGDKLSW